MKHYEERLQHDLSEIKGRLSGVGESVSQAMGHAVRALLSVDEALAGHVVLGDLPINREVREIDRKCHAFVARHLPSAGHLRFVSAALRLGIQLERIGDYAVTVAREAMQLREPLPEWVERDVELFADQAVHMLDQALAAFREESPDLARGTKGMEDQIDRTFDMVFADLLREGRDGELAVHTLFALLIVFNRLERVSDQAKNICEEVIFAATGETKPPKRYSVLFVDETNDGASLLAAAYAGKAFPESGRYASAGWSPATSIRPDVADFLDGRGYDVASLAPSALDTSHDVMADYFVIVALDPGAREAVGTPPFGSVVIDWAPPAATDDLEGTLRFLAHEIRELMAQLRGEAHLA